jgi:hypothetical protein
MGVVERIDDPAAPGVDPDVPGPPEDVPRADLIERHLGELARDVARGARDVHADRAPGPLDEPGAIEA